MIQIVGRPGTGSLPSTIAPPDHPRLYCVMMSEKQQIKSAAEKPPRMMSFIHQKLYTLFDFFSVRSIISTNENQEQYFQKWRSHEENITLRVHA